MRLWLGAGLALFLAPPSASAAVGLGLPLVAAAITGVAIAIVLAAMLSRRLFLATGFAFATRRWLAVAAAAGTVAAAVQLFPLTVFMIDSSRVEYSTQPSDPFRRRHSCMTSYAEGARFASDGTLNIYERAPYQIRDIGQLQGSLQWDYAHLLPLRADQTDLSCPDLLVHAWLDADESSSIVFL